MARDLEEVAHKLLAPRSRRNPYPCCFLNSESHQRIGGSLIEDVRLLTESDPARLIRAGLSEIGADFLPVGEIALDVGTNDDHGNVSGEPVVDVLLLAREL